MYLTSRPLAKPLASLLYPNSEHNRVAYKKTHKCDVFVHSNDLRMNAYEAAVEILKKGKQCFVIMPDLDFKIDEMQQRIFNGWNIGVVKSDTPTKEVFRVLNDFKNWDIDILICTRDVNFNIKTHCEVVGIVENADRLGLSKLHQIRNLIIRRFENSQLHLICFSKSKLAFNRLKSFSEVMDGATLVARDLESRDDASKLGLNK